MSHTTTIRSVAIRDIAALNAAVAELKAQGVECDLYHASERKPRMYYSSQVTDLEKNGLEYTLHLKNSSYDIGFCKQEDGSYAPAFDAFSGSVRKQVGIPDNACPIPENDEERAQFRTQQDIGKLMQLYAKHAAINAAVAQGYQVESCTVGEDGSVQLSINAGEGY